MKQRGFPAFIAGGAVRDILMGRPPEDYDVATTASPDTVMSLFPRTKPVGKAFGTTLVILEHRPYQITTLQSSGGTFTDVIEKDILRRDFTINAMFWDPLEDRLIDIVGGMKDMKARVIRPVTSTDQIFTDDPIRMLRAVRFAFSLRFTLIPSLRGGIRRHRETIHRISPERVHDELVKILALPSVLEALCPLVTSRLLFEIFPEMSSLSGLKQFPNHEFSALSHTFRVLNQLEKLLHAPPFPLPPDMPGKHVFMMSALLHDIGKPETHTVEGGYHHFYDHEDVGAIKAADIMRRLKFPKKEVILVKNLVARHLYPLHLFGLYRENRLTQRAVDRFKRKTRRFIIPLLLLSTADQLAKHRHRDKPQVKSWLKFVELLIQDNSRP